MTQHKWEVANALGDLCIKCGMRRELTNDLERPYIYWPPNQTKWDGTSLNEGRCPWWETKKETTPSPYQGFKTPTPKYRKE